MKCSIKLLTILLLVLLSGCAARTIHITVTCECQALPAIQDGAIYPNVILSNPWYPEGLDFDFDLDRCVELQPGTWICATDMSIKEGADANIP